MKKKLCILMAAGLLLLPASPAMAGKNEDRIAELEAKVAALEQRVSDLEQLTTCSAETESAEEANGLDFVDESGFMLDGISVTADELIDIYRELKDAFSYEKIPEDPDEAEAYEHETFKLIGADNGLTEEQALNIFNYVSMYGIPGANKEFSLRFGDLRDTTINGTSLIIKAKISPSYSKEATIDQNYYSVCDIIKNQGGDKYDSIQYWAVADMTDGSEGKVISFTVPKQIIDRVVSGEIVDNKLGDYLEDLWILPSLL
ncbi:MAG: hypothetical protein K6E91_09085 [Butyrivibrio sp.]|nr:hypothetical protein [Butyrivibrio sp.]